MEALVSKCFALIFDGVAAGLFMVGAICVAVLPLALVYQVFAWLQHGAWIELPASQFFGSVTLEWKGIETIINESLSLHVGVFGLFLSYVFFIAATKLTELGKQLERRATSQQKSHVK